MGKTNFDQLMKRWLTNQATEEERIKIEAWLDTMKTENTDDLELTDEEEEVLYRKIISKEDNIRDIKAFKPESLRKRRRSTWGLRIAASLLLISVIGIGAYFLNTRDQNVYTIFASNNPEKILLNDGSLVWINRGGKLSYYEKEGGRFAELEGEALFEVAKNPDKPFTIQFKDVNLKGVTVRVVGTSFHLKTGEQVELKVLTGIVNLSTSNDISGQNIQPNEKATYSIEEGIQRYPLQQSEAKGIVEHTEYDMKFVNETFANVVIRLEKKFDVTVKLPSDEVGQCHVNLDITDHSLQSSLDMISSVLNLEYAIAGSKVVLTGTGCK